MIQTQNVSGRRILTSPAIHPCEDISPHTLLSSLISLARNICSYRSKFFATNKRNARESIRQIGVILVFLEEIREWDSGLPGSVVLGFSELHLAFQKARFLLEDCTRDGARVWMLMNSERVANQFRFLARAIATALDVLPLALIDAPVDVKDHVELVMKQARKRRFDVDPDDKRVMGAVISVLSGFENGVVPDKGDLKWVLDYLGIRRWSSCNKEVKFLDSEMELENLNDEKKQLDMLSSLLGLVCYCRCVAFDVVDDEPKRQSNGKCTSEALIGLKPDDLRCPISLEIMVDPVTVASGHTYDRASITKWFRAGNSICPKTGEKLENMEMVPNSALRRLIQLYCSENSIPLVDSGHRNRHVKRAVLAGSLAAEKAMKMVSDYLMVMLTAGTGMGQNKAAYETRVLSKTSVFNRSCLVEAGVIPPLLKLLLSTDSLTQENATAALLNLSKHSECKASIVHNGGLEVLIDVLKKGLNLEARQHAAGVLFYLASVEENRILIGENPETVPALMELIRNGTDRGKKNALVAIFGLLAHPGNHSRVLAAGTVPLLVNLLMSADAEDDLVTDSLAILATLAEKPDGTTAIVRHGSLDSIAEILNAATSRAGKEYCVSLLLALCRNGGRDVVALLVKSPSLMGSLYSLLSEGTSRASKKAGALIRVLHEFYERKSSGLMAPGFSQERFVHVW
ncbi:Beta-catenin [Trema orientale]|uniref:RING-type E3 ubiquitin transferase n=1 Tax=Trema orientale TaxID=63057 RepID=A0A2P5FMF5_TREOI|nr:Beta-catenin [Trema orientale]